MAVVGDIPTRAGIYEIRNTVDGKRYIGSAMQLRKRWRDHRDALLGKTGRTNPRLQNAWNKYGPGAFVFRPLLFCSASDLLFYEQLALDSLRPEYNIRRVAESNVGITWSAEVRERMAAAKRGVKRGPLSKERRAKLSEAHMGKRLSPEHRAKISEVQRGRVRGPRPPDVVAKVAAANRGKVRTSAMRRQVSESKGGLTDDQVMDIRRRIASGESNKSVSDSTGVDPTTVSKIKHGKRYTWVPAIA